MTTIPTTERRRLYELARNLDILSTRELQVIHYWAAGIGIRKTAATLELSESTVRTFRDRALTKLERLILNLAA